LELGVDATKSMMRPNIRRSYVSSPRSPKETTPLDQAFICGTAFRERKGRRIRNLGAVHPIPPFSDTPWLLKMAIEIMDLPMKNGDFP